jgi:hypothetical protein
MYLYDLSHRAKDNNFTHDDRHSEHVDYSHASSNQAENISSDIDGVSTESTTHRIDIMPQAQAAENAVEYALRQLEENRYFVFRDLIIPSSSKSMSLTQIDHVVVSRKGIFCIETKSNNGNIYGRSRSESWKQYLGNNGKPYALNSPFRQNHHHVKSLEILLQGKLRAPVHSYIAFPNARRVVVDGVIEDMSPAGVVLKIQRHQRDVYDYAGVENIAKILAHAGTLRDQLRDRHINDVRAFLEAKVSKSLKLS